MKYSQNGQKRMWLMIGNSDSDEEEPNEKLPSTKQMLEALQILHSRIQQRGDFDVLKLH